jgi:hypothetical protein
MAGPIIPPLGGIDPAPDAAVRRSGA